MEHTDNGQRRLDLKIAQKLYDIGLPDREIAHCCGVHINTIYRWRHAYGLRPNPDMARATGPMEQLTIDAIAAKKHDMNYGSYIAKKHGGPFVIIPEGLKTAKQKNE